MTTDLQLVTPGRNIIIMPPLFITFFNQYTHICFRCTVMKCILFILLKIIFWKKLYENHLK